MGGTFARRLGKYQIRLHCCAASAPINARLSWLLTGARLILKARISGCQRQNFLSSNTIASLSRKSVSLIYREAVEQPHAGSALKPLLATVARERYFDPANEDDAFAKIERLLLDPDYLTEREAQLRSEYRQRTWADCVDALVATFDQTTPYDQLVKDTIAEADREIDQRGEKAQLRYHGGSPEYD